MSTGVTLRVWLRRAVAVGTILAVADVATRQPRWLTWPAARALGAVVVHVPTRRRAIALTFDDGPHEDVTPALLDVLARHGGTRPSSSWAAASPAASPSWSVSPRRATSLATT